MTTDERDRSATDDADSLLRAIAAAPGRPDEVPPTRVAHFRILGRLGQGGMGVVYRAEDEQLRRTVALKLLPDASRDEEKRQRFIREARAAAGITHPNVAVVYQVGEADGRIYIAMELVEGENLRARLDRERLDVTVARELALQIARGLSAAHERGIVHRDLKPENVMITPAGQAKILDFGLAKLAVAPRSPGATEAALAKTETLVTSDEGRVMGTPEYMSPEQALGEVVDVRSDVFSFGIVLYEMLAGVRPFAGASTGAVLVAIARDAAPPLRERAPEVDTATEAVVGRCLAKGPAERFQSAGQIAAALGRGAATPVSDSRTDVEPLSTPRALPSPRNERAWRWWVLGAGTSAVVALLGGALTRQSNRNHASPSAFDAAEARSQAIVITDLPVPATSSPEAAAAYRAALQSYRDGSLARSCHDLERAMRADPSMASAYLRLAAWAGITGRAEGENFVRAKELRASLDARDRSILEAFEPFFAAPQDLIAWRGSLAKLAASSNGDAEILFLNAVASTPTWADTAREEPWRPVLAADPRFGMVWNSRAIASLMVGESDEATAAIDAWSRIDPANDGITYYRFLAHQARGECTLMEDDVRTGLVRGLNTGGYLWLAEALASAGEPREAVGGAIEQASRGAKTVDEHRLVESYRRKVSLAYADFRDVQHRVAVLYEGARDAPPSDDEVIDLVLAADEVGARGAGTQLARRFWRSRAIERRHVDSVFPPEGAHVAEAVLGARLAREGVIPSEELALARSGWMSDLTTTYGGVEQENAWAYVFADSVESPNEAFAALATLGHPVTLRPQAELALASFILGKLNFFLGAFDDAIPSLEIATHSCNALLRPIEQTHAFEMLGEAREAKGDAKGACAAYKVVVDRWGMAVPTSVTATRARAHAKALSCW